jgi:hypothetical protein
MRVTKLSHHSFWHEYTKSDASSDVTYARGADPYAFRNKESTVDVEAVEALPSVESRKG